MFEDLKVELLPARTTMKKWGRGGFQSGNTAVAIAANVENVNHGDGDQFNVAVAEAAAGSNFWG